MAGMPAGLSRHVGRPTAVAAPQWGNRAVPRSMILAQRSVNHDESVWNRNAAARHHSRRRVRHAAVPGDARGVEAAAAGLRQADDLLPAVHADAGRASATILIITTPHDKPAFQRLLGDGVQLGCQLQLRGAADARTAWPGVHHRRASSSAATPSALVLGDNIFYGHDLPERCAAAGRTTSTAPPSSAITWPTPSATASWSSTQRGTAPLDRGEARAAEIELRRHRPLLLRRPTWSSSPPRSKPSARGELEITDLNRIYLERGELRGRGAGPRLRLAGHRHARVVARGGPSSGGCGSYFRYCAVPKRSRNRTPLGQLLSAQPIFTGGDGCGLWFRRP